VKLTIRIDMIGGESFAWDIPIEKAKIVRGIALAVDGADVMRQGFSVHDKEYTRLHTICRRNSDEIDQIDW